MEPSALSILAAHLSKRMRARFGEAAANAKGADIIRREVAAFMRRVGSDSIREEDISTLESKIRSKLTGCTPPKLTMSLEKKAQVEGDEWAQIFQFHIQRGLAQERAERAARRQRQVLTRQQLDQQMRELDARAKAEKEEAQAYYRSEQATLREWESQEDSKRQLQSTIMRRLGQERVDQLREKETRRLQAGQKVRDEENDLAARIAYTTLKELREEEEHTATQRTQLRSFLAGNEHNKLLREEAKRRQAEEDAEFQRKWQAQLDKQEEDRRKLLEKTRAKQNLQAEAAASRPECKRWIDQEIIDRHYRAREEAQERDERERKQRIWDAEKAAVHTLTLQMRERDEVKRQEREQDKEMARIVFERVSREEEREREAQRRALEAKARFKSVLGTQMKENARRRRVAPMTEFERQYNTGLLVQVEEWRQTGRLPPPSA